MFWDYLPLLITGASTVASLLGAGKEKKADVSSLLAEKTASNYNAAIALRNAKLVRQLAQAEAVQIQRQNRLRVGQIRAAVGGAGIKQSGSALDALADVVAQGELDRQNALYRGEIQAIGYEEEAQLNKMRAGSATSSARDVNSAYPFQAASILLRGASQGYDQYQSLTRT